MKLVCFIVISLGIQTIHESICLCLLFLIQTINFFRLASKLCLVDLPGYGFAYAKDEVKDSWQELVSTLNHEKKSCNESYYLTSCNLMKLDI